MPQSLPAAPEGLSTLVGGIIDDFQRLLRQELALARREMIQEWAKTKTAIALLVGGVVALGLGGVLLGFMAVYLLKLVFPDLDESACFGIVGATLALAGGGMIAAGISGLEAINLVPPKTVQSIQDNIEAVTSAVTSDEPAAGPLARK